ncbi:MAG TPA: N-acetylneuraminate synthase [Phycisphaerales bacterium]|nr:N-acetylneuraminate synthase [Phycisphaerales bacterium]
MAEPPRIIAEIGCNHRGDMDTAREMVVAAAQFCKADVVKFQKRCPQELLTKDELAAPHPNPMHAYGETYGAHRAFLEFDVGQHRQLQEWCVESGVEYSSSVWDTISAREITSLDPSFIKIPSACNLHWRMLDYLCVNYGGEIHLSFGMTTHDEENAIIEFFQKRGRAEDLVVYSCTSGYPVAFEDICLREITRLKEKFDGIVKGIGFSGHHLGIAADVAAMTLGARWVERHFTLDRTWKGTDHAASLEPDGMRRLARDLRSVSLALRTKDREILEVERVQREKLKYAAGGSE